MAEIIENDKELAEDTTQDNNNIEFIMKFGFFLKTLKLIIVIINSSYFMGVFWLIYCQITTYLYEEYSPEEWFDSEPNKDGGYDKVGREYFYYKWELDKLTDNEKTIKVMYYAFTSLSTVGFGDLSPRNSAERVMVAFILLFGVALFSYIMSIFSEMV